MEHQLYEWRTLVHLYVVFQTLVLFHRNMIAHFLTSTHITIYCSVVITVCDEVNYSHNDSRLCIEQWMLQSR